jgi:hypothetical protein
MADSYYRNACLVREVYQPGFAFPAWVLNEDEWRTAAFTETVVFFHSQDSLAEVQKLATEREPCNIAMSRMYDESAMLQHFGWRRGAYACGSPNFAVLCHATARTTPERSVRVWVINLIGVAHDHPLQPDWQARSTREQVLAAYAAMWQLALAAVRRLARARAIDSVRVYNVGGGAFDGGLFDSFERDCFDATFLPLVPAIQAEGVEVLRGGRIPDALGAAASARTLFVNAWDPWSLVGNGNAMDDSLDGCWGRCSNLAVLAWPRTNPHMQWIAV